MSGQGAISEVRSSGLGTAQARRCLSLGAVAAAKQPDGQNSAGPFGQISATGSDGGGTLIMRGIEFGAAGLVLLFGLGLLFGYLAAERVTCL